MQCWTQASKPEPLKQDIQKEKENKLIFNTLRYVIYIYVQKHNLNENTNLTQYDIQMN